MGFETASAQRALICTPLETGSQAVAALVPDVLVCTGTFRFSANFLMGACRITSPLPAGAGCCRFTVCVARGLLLVVDRDVLYCEATRLTAGRLFRGVATVRTVSTLLERFVNHVLVLLTAV